MELNHLRCAAVTTVYLSAALSSQAETVSPRNDRPNVPHPARGHTTVPPVSRTSLLRLAGGGAWRDFVAVPLGRIHCRLSRSSAQLSGRAAQGHFCRPSCRWRPDFANRMFRRLPVTFMPLKPLEAWPVRACVQNPLGRAPAPPPRGSLLHLAGAAVGRGGGDRRGGDVAPCLSFPCGRGRLPATAVVRRGLSAEPRSGSGAFFSLPVGGFAPSAGAAGVLRVWSSPWNKSIIGFEIIAYCQSSQRSH